LSGDAVLSAESRRTRILILAAALTITALAWFYVASLAATMAAPADASMPDMPGMDMSNTGLMAPALAPWSIGHAAFVFCMWAVMMVGMMTPSVTPMVLIYARVMHSGGSPRQLLAPVAWFAAGYLLAWCLFSAVATLMQWSLEALALITPMMAAAHTAFGGAVLIAAGIYQWLPLKQACLAGCRAPLAFMQRHGGFQTSATGSLRLGLLHGMYCVGCCWALMTVLFVVGVMNLLWIAALMILVLLEKVIPSGHRLAQLTGCVAIAAGLWMIAAR
jgi:predicted metal-binding membrane protein